MTIFYDADGLIQTNATATETRRLWREFQSGGAEFGRAGFALFLRARGFDATRQATPLPPCLLELLGRRN